MTMAEEDNRRDIGKLWGAHRGLASAVWGDDVRRDNGLRSDVRVLQDSHTELKGKVTEAIEWGHRVWEVERPESCLGIPAVESLRQEIEEREAHAVAVRETEAIERRREMVELRKARIAMMGTVGAAMLTSIAAVAVSLIR